MSRMNPLFSNADIFSVSEYQKDLFEKAFQEVSNAELDSNTAGVLARLVEQFGINVPVLDTENKHALPPRETQIDVRDDPMQRFIS
jgi:hypothetical protein